MKPNGRTLAALAVGVAVGAGVSIPATALAQDGGRPEPAPQTQAVEARAAMNGMSAMMPMMGGMARAAADDDKENGLTQEDMQQMARLCAQMMDTPGMQRMHDRMMDDSSGGMDQMMGGM